MNQLHVTGVMLAAAVTTAASADLLIPISQERYLEVSAGYWNAFGGSGSESDFIGHAGGDNFIIITYQKDVKELVSAVKSRFAEDIATHYTFSDREEGCITVKSESGDKKEPHMKLAAGVVSPKTHMFADIREITEIAVEERLKDTAID